MITTRQLEIYNNLLSYTQSGETFFTSDHVWDGQTYRIFSYRLGGYTEFMQPDALEGRGIMFQLDDNKQPIRLACRPMSKFFNLNENPSTMSLNFAQENVQIVMDKVDGSLISTWTDHNGKLQLKSKTSLVSDQVQMAWKILRADTIPINFGNGEQRTLLQLLEEIAETGTATVNMEVIGPENRIVIGYEKPELRVLNTRLMEDGEYDFSMHYWDQHPLFCFAGGSKPVGYDFVTEIENGIGFEGVVVVLTSGEWFKMKTPWYAALHKTKDSINSKRKLFEAIVCETADDLKAMFFDDPLALQLIVDMEVLVIPQFNAFIKLVDTFYESNKQLDRKSYAIKGQKELQREVFSNAMSKYLGREINYKEWAIKHIELFGVKDEPTPIAKEE
jgi:T4 RnlA family RNA ligase